MARRNPVRFPFRKNLASFPISMLFVRITHAEFQTGPSPLTAIAKHELRVFYSVIVYEIHIERLLIFTMTEPLPMSDILAMRGISVCHPRILFR